MKKMISVTLSILVIMVGLSSCSSKKVDVSGIEDPSGTNLIDIETSTTSGIGLAVTDPENSDGTTNGAEDSPSGSSGNSSGGGISNGADSTDGNSGTTGTNGNPQKPNETIVRPTIINTKYTTEDVVIADVVATDSEYGADPSGSKDSTNAIQKALNACRSMGGGTVWLPAGKYKVTSKIDIPAFVTLRGDWQDPDTGNDYGTIILAQPSTSKSPTPGLINISGSAGAMGLTVYYPDQSIDSVKEYPFTFYVNGSGEGYMAQSIVNCTILNGYRGIGATINSGEVHEMMTVDNVRMTCLNVGAYAMDQADVGTWKNVTINNKYWANAGAGLNKADKTKLDTYTRKNTTGLMLGDLEWTEFSNLKIDGCKTGINIIKGKRIEFAGSIFDLNITNCNIGLLVDYIDKRWGMLVAKSSISGSEFSVVNNSKNNKMAGTIKLAGVTLSGAKKGNDIVEESSSLNAITVEHNRAARKPNTKLIVISADKTGKTDISTNLQKALTDMGKAGGGVVYLPAGKYHLSNPVTVPKGVELRGASSVAQREQSGNSNGTLIYAYYGRTENHDSDTALFTLEGENAGVRGVRFIYPENNFLNGVKKYSFTIRGKASGVYVINCAISAGYNGVDFRNCDNHLIDKLIGCVYNNMMTVGGTGGMVEGCLQNGTAIYRNGCNFSGWPKDESKIWAQLFDPITRPNTEFIRVQNATNQTILNTFAYGVKSLVVSNQSNGVKVVNVGADNIGTNMPLLKTTGGSLSGVNIMRYNGKSYENSETALILYNRITINDKNEKTVK